MDHPDNEQRGTRPCAVHDVERQTERVPARQLAHRQARLATLARTHLEVAVPERAHAGIHVRSNTLSQLPPRIARTSSSENPRATSPRVTLGQPYTVSKPATYFSWIV